MGKQIGVMDMTKTEAKRMAQDLIMEQIAIIGYGDRYEEFSSHFDSQEEADACVKAQMDRVAKVMGYKEAWFE